MNNTLSASREECLNTKLFVSSVFIFFSGMTLKHTIIHHFSRDQTTSLFFLSLLSLIATLLFKLKPLECWTCRVLDFPSRKHNLTSFIPTAPCSFHLTHYTFRKYGTLVNLMQQMRLPLHMQAVQSHSHSLGQANLIMNEVMIGSYTWVVDHSCSFLNEGCGSGFKIWWLF